MGFGEDTGRGWTKYVTLTAGGSITIVDAVSAGRHVIYSVYIGTTGGSASNTISFYEQGATGTVPFFRFAIGTTVGYLQLDFNPAGLALQSTNSRLFLNTSGTGSVSAIFMGMTRK